MKNFYLLNNKKLLLVAFNNITKNFVAEYIKKNNESSRTSSIKNEIILMKDIILGKSLQSMNEQSQILLNSYNEDFKINNNLKNYYHTLNKDEHYLMQLFSVYKRGIDNNSFNHITQNKAHKNITYNLNTFNESFKEQYQQISLINVRPIILFMGVVSLFKLYKNQPTIKPLDNDITQDIIMNIIDMVKHPSSKKYFVQKIFDESIACQHNDSFTFLFNNKEYKDILVPENTLNFNTFLIQTYKKCISENNVFQVDFLNEQFQNIDFLNQPEKAKILIRECYLLSSRECLHSLFAANIACDGAAIYLPTSRKYLKNPISEAIYNDIALYESKQKKSSLKM